MAELKPCPFCGGEVKICFDFRYEVYEVNCCRCNGTYTHWHGVVDEAIEAWNRRANDGQR